MLTEKTIRENRKKINSQIRLTIKQMRKLKPKGRPYKKLEKELSDLRAQSKVMGKILNGKTLQYKDIKNPRTSSSFIQKMNIIKPLVKEVLKTDAVSRDDDNVLCIRVWEKQGTMPTMSLTSFQIKLVMGKYALPESITRSRRSLQEKHKSLRGKLYEARHQADEAFKKQYKLDF